MSTATITRPASLNLYDTKASTNQPVVTRQAVCRNPECRLELTGIEKARTARYNGMCEDCHDSGVTITQPPAAPAQVTDETAPETAARLTAQGLDPATHDVRRCGNCDTNISTLAAGAEYCSAPCKAEATATQPAKATKPKPINPDILMAVRFLIRDDLSEFEIRTGLNTAFLDRRHNGDGKKWTAEAVAGAGRAWFEDYNRNTYQRGARNTKVLKALQAVARLI